MKWSAIVLGVLLVALTGCSSGGQLAEPAPAATPDAVTPPAKPPKPPYDGPLFVEVPEASDDDVTVDRTGAAGLAVDCTTSKRGSSTESPFEEAAGTTPLNAIEVQAGGGSVPWGNDTLREVRREGDRVLLTSQIDGVVKFAAVTREGENVANDKGWYVESYAICDWAELPATVAEDAGYQIWTDATGQRVDTTKIHSQAGPEHCDWQNVTFLAIDSGHLDGGQTYLAGRIPEWPDQFDQPYVKALALPADAVDSGYHLGDQHLWFSADRKLAYVGTKDVVEQWPSPPRNFACE